MQDEGRFDDMHRSLRHMFLQRRRTQQWCKSIRCLNCDDRMHRRRPVEEKRAFLQRCLACFAMDDDFRICVASYEDFRYGRDDSEIWTCIEFRNHHGWHEIFWLSRCADGIMLAVDDDRFAPYLYRPETFGVFLNSIESFDYHVCPYIGKYLDFQPIIQQ